MQHLHCNKTILPSCIKKLLLTRKELRSWVPHKTNRCKEHTNKCEHNGDSHTSVQIPQLFHWPKDSGHVFSFFFSNLNLKKYLVEKFQLHSNSCTPKQLEAFICTPDCFTVAVIVPLKCFIIKHVP